MVLDKLITRVYTSRRDHHHARYWLNDMATLFPSPSPVLPDFQTLLIKGDIHASAPIHFCYSWVLEHDVLKAVLLTPSRAQFVHSLKNFKDEWVSKHGSDGLTCKAASRVNVL
jgi:hypothetical protein